MEWLNTITQDALFLQTVKALAVMLVVLSMAGYTVIIERNVCAWIQGRIGPNRTTTPFIAIIPVLGPVIRRLGIPQLAADGLKMFLREEQVPGHVKKFYFNLAPMIVFTVPLLLLTVVPFGVMWDAELGRHIPLVLADLDVGIVFILAISSLGVYGIILGGWASNSKYPFFGGLRASAQMISYELTLATSLIPLFLFNDGTFNLTHMVNGQGGLFWNIFLFPLSAFLFLVSLFAETNRLPFDMPESETDLVAGYNTEYGSFKFGMFFAAEYAHIVIGSSVFTVLFLGGWNLPFITYPHSLFWSLSLSIAVFLAKTFVLVFLFVQIRWTLPRFRSEQVMKLGWSVLLPLAILNLFIYTSGLAIYSYAQ